MKICAESPEEAVEPSVRLYPDLDDDGGKGSTGEGSGGFRSHGKSKAQAPTYEDSLLSTLEMSPSKKSRTF